MLDSFHEQEEGCKEGVYTFRLLLMSSICCLVAQLTVMSDKSMPVFFSGPFLSQTFSRRPFPLNQMHVVVFSESDFHVEHLLYPPDIVLCLLAPCWSPGH